MDASLIASYGKLGGTIAVCLAAVGSALGTGTAGMTAIGAWKKCYAQNKAAPFVLLTFVGAPMSQTIYGMIIMFQMLDKAGGGAAWPLLLGSGFFGGIAMGMSAWYQGRAGAAGAVALAETGQGFTNYLSVIGIVETIAIFVMVFIIMALG